MEILVTIRPDDERVIMRVWIDGAKRCEQETDIQGFVIWMLLHSDELADNPHLIEIEILSEPDPLKRFMRFGTDPARMVEPQPFQLPKHWNN